MRDHSDGTTSVRLALPPLIIHGVKLFAERNRSPLPLAFRLFVSQLEVAIRKDPKFMGDVWADLFKASRDDAAVQAFAAGQLKIDYDRLAKNPNIQSGFVGVYVNGRGGGFKVMGKDPVTKALKYLGTFNDAAEGAWHRYLHYKKHKLPYGILEEEIDRLRATPEGKAMSEDEARRVALEYLRMVKLDHKLEPEEQAEAQRNFEEKYPKQAKLASDKPSPNHPRRVGPVADTAGRIDDRFTHEDGDPEGDK